ncbi:MAG TPA: coproporphyrinogen-III oxidase family protein [Candidatus Krumholzibacteria bacterium]|nr:coproporphyrinogen-III oxidase family protein [Candidatus Krumholzibacteria bacterium]
MSTAHSLYVHVPFCDVRCPYCHFTCFVNRDPELPERWARAVVREWGLHRERGRAERVASVYFGGGTPSALPPGARERIGTWLADDVVPRLEPEAEVTVEVNPESAWPESLRPWVEAGANRLSVGVQSMDPDVLTFLGRLNTPRSNLRALDLACSLVENVSADLIVGTPADDRRKLAASIEAITALPIVHVSAYLLEIHRTTRFGRDVASGRWQPTPDDEQADRYLEMVDRLAARGLEAYELSNFALAPFEAQHNARYWAREAYLGLGPSAHSYEPERRWSNLRDTRAWCEAVETGRLETEVDERLDHAAVRRERILLGLRRREGVPTAWLVERDRWCHEAARSGLLTRRGDRWAATPTGWLVLDQIVAQLTD